MSVKCECSEKNTILIECQRVRKIYEKIYDIECQRVRRKYGEVQHWLSVREYGEYTEKVQYWLIDCKRKIAKQKHHSSFFSSKGAFSGLLPCLSCFSRSYYTFIVYIDKTPQRPHWFEKNRVKKFSLNNLKLYHEKKVRRVHFNKI